MYIAIGYIFHPELGKQPINRDIKFQDMEEFQTTIESLKCNYIAMLEECDEDE